MNEADTVEVELPKMLNLFKDLTQIAKKNKNNLEITHVWGFFLTDNRKYLYSEEISLDVADNITTLAKSNYVELKSVKLRITISDKQYFRVFLHYKIVDLEQKIELFGYALDELLIQQKYFYNYFSLNYLVKD